MIPANKKNWYETRNKRKAVLTTFHRSTFSKLEIQSKTGSYF